MINIPVACTGGLLALLATGVNFSVSAAMGFISIFGIAIQDAILVVTYFQRLKVDGRSIENAAREAAEKRLRPVLMTTLVAMIGLLPAAISQGIGAQAQKPLAIVVIGGSLMLAIMPRILQPPLLVIAHRFMARHPSNSNGSGSENGEAYRRCRSAQSGKLASSPRTMRYRLDFVGLVPTFCVSFFRSATNMTHGCSPFPIFQDLRVFRRERVPPARSSTAVALWARGRG